MRDVAADTNDVLRDLAREAGVALEWTNNAGERLSVSVATMRAILVSMGIDCAGKYQIAESLARLRRERRSPSAYRLITAVAGENVVIPFDIENGARVILEYENGGVLEQRVATDQANQSSLPPIERIGYHRLQIGKREIVLAVAPRRCWTTGDIARGQKMWGLSAQVHGLRRTGDGGIGDFGSVEQLARVAASARADALSLSPTHALFGADDNHFTPYSPSNRLFLNILLADPAATFDTERVANARDTSTTADEWTRLEQADLIDWPNAARARKAMLASLFQSFRARELCAMNDPLTCDFHQFRANGGEALEQHAIFEALHERHFTSDFTKWAWRDWPEAFRDCRSSEVRQFAAKNSDEVSRHVFMQWLADRSLRRAHGAARESGMRIGLVSDLAIGMNDGGSHAWSAPKDLLLGLSIGAPPDALAPRGQNWGLTTFSPPALQAAGYAPFLATLRAALRHAGGVRIDHVMGMARLWLTPNGMDARDGAYLSFPMTDLLRLIALESRGHRAIVIGEDLGTVPNGMRETLATSGIMGIRVLQFERYEEKFNPPDWYPAHAVATTSTHDTATTAGYWTGHDLDIRAATNQLPPWHTLESARTERAHARDALWSAFRTAGVASNDDIPPPEHHAPVVDSAIAFIARGPAELTILPLEDALDLIEQPNLPGTTSEHPNWRRRYPGEIRDTISTPAVARRLRWLSERT